MCRKRSIACWLLAVYLLMAIGPACASLSCRCKAAHARTEALCCHARHHHAAADDAAEHAAEWSAACHCDRHSTEIALYTSNSDDRTDKNVLPVLAALVPDEVPVVADRSFYERITDRRVGFLCHGTVRCTGLRAPPVSI